MNTTTRNNNNGNSNSLTIDTTNPHVWYFVGEGGKHALFASRRNSNRRNSRSRPALLLRVRKHDLAYSSTSIVLQNDEVDEVDEMMMLDSNSNSNSNDDNNDNNDSNLNYSKYIVRPKLGKEYVDIPTIVNLNWKFLLELRSNTLRVFELSSNKSLLQLQRLRLKDWYPKVVPPARARRRRRPSSTVVVPPRGMILVDYKQLVLPDEDEEEQEEEEDHKNKSCCCTCTCTCTCRLPTTTTTTTIPSSSSSSTATPSPNPNATPTTTTTTTPTTTTISFEIKPKGGYVAYSPFVQTQQQSQEESSSKPLLPMKYLQTRYALLQQLYTMGYIEKGWIQESQQSQQSQSQQQSRTTTTNSTSTSSSSSSMDSTTTTINNTTNTANNFRISTYNPLDMFSNDLTRIKHSIVQLFQNPQNNMKVFVNGSGSSIVVSSSLQQQQERKRIVEEGVVFDSNSNDDQTDLMTSIFVVPSVVKSTTIKDSTTKAKATTTTTTLSSSNENDDDNDRDEDDLYDILSNIVATILSSSSSSSSSTSSSSSNKNDNDDDDNDGCNDNTTMPLLQRILHLQRELDVIDGDGAILIYNHLVSKFYNGSQQHAEKDIDTYNYDSYISSSDTSTKNPCSRSSTIKLLSISPFPFPTCTNNDDNNIIINNNAAFDNGVTKRRTTPTTTTLEKLCIQIEKFRQLLPDRSRNHAVSSEGTCSQSVVAQDCECDASPNVLPFTDEMGRIRKESLRLVDSLSREECIYLLQNWLLSLAMCDVSIFVTIRYLGEDLDHALLLLGIDNNQQQKQQQQEYHDDNVSQREEATEGSSNSSRTSIVKTMTVNHPGLLRWTDCQSGVSKYFAYIVKTIDYDPKPAKKLRSRHKKEVVFRYLQSSPTG